MADANNSRKRPTNADWSEFLKLLEISQLQISCSSSSGTPEFDKICVLITHIPTGCSAFRFWPYCRVYVIDVNSDSDSDLNASPPRLQSVEPLIYWDTVKLGHHAFAMLGSKLFMFGGLVKLYGSLHWGDGMSYYDMEPLLSSPQQNNTPPLLISKDLLKVGPPMLGKKVRPCAVVMGDSKICVFGSILYLKGKISSCPNFELLSITTTSGGGLDPKWEKLPDPLEYEDLDYHFIFHNSVSIQSYCVHRSCLIIKLVGLGVYGINVDYEKPQWVTLNRSENTSFPLYGMFAMVDEILCDGFYAAKRDSPFQDTIEFEVPPNRGSDLAISPKRAQCFDDRCNAFCLAQPAFATDDDTSYLLLDIVKFDAELLSKLPSDVADWPEIKIKKSFTFQLPKTSFSESMEMIACLPIKNVSRNNKSVASEVDQGKRRKNKKRTVKKPMKRLKP